MPPYRIRHSTRYTYPAPVIDSANQVMLYPQTSPTQTIVDHRISISHDPAVEVYTDYFGNNVGMFSLIQPHYALEIVAETEVETHAPAWANAAPSTPADWHRIEELSDLPAFIDFLTEEPFEASTELHSIVDEIRGHSPSPLEAAQEMSAYVYEGFEYKKGITRVDTPVDDIWKLKAGVCQDFAHILLVMLRGAGIPARYVSGYICPHPDNTFRGEGATHAWVEAYLPAMEWVGLDPTNNCLAEDRHVKLGIGRRFEDCTPVKGTYKGSSAQVLEVSVVIDNGEAAPVVETDATQPFAYQVENKPLPPENSYRKFVEMQQQQQQ